MKKICFVDFDMSVVGGVEQVTASLANALCDRYQVYVYDINSNGALKYDLDSKVRHMKGLEEKRRLREMITGSFFRFIRFINRKQIDTVFLMGNYPALIVSFTRFFTKAKYVYCDHGALMNQWHQKDITAIRFWNAVTAHKIVVLTEKTREDYIQKFRLKREKIQCVYNWIEDTVAEARKPYDTASRKILSVGRIGKEKGYDMLVDMARNLLPRNPEWQWDIYGTGEMEESISKKIKKYGLEKQLRMKGNVEEVYRLYAEYSFLVLPSYREGLPLVLLEALALGIPMVSFDIETGPSEIIENGKNGFLIPPYHKEMMEEKIQDLMDDVNMRKKFSSYCGRKDKFSKDTIIKQWIRLIEE